MARLTGLVPVGQGVAAYTALTREAERLLAAGDGRSKGQIMADTFIERLTGQAAAADVAVEIALIMTDDTLFGTDGPAPEHATKPGDAASGAGADEPAHLLGYGPVPAGLARRLVFDPAADAPRWLRRLFRHPRTGELVAMDSRRRLFTASQRQFLHMRDQSCRTPWCEAPIRHVDHVVPAEHGGPTSISNGQGYCAACNYAKQAPGWHAGPTGSPGEFWLSTPTGHSYVHRPPAPPGGTHARSRSPNRHQPAA